MTQEEVWVLLYVDACSIGMSSRSLSSKDAADLADKRLVEWEKRFGQNKPATKDSKREALERIGISDSIALDIAGRAT